MLNHLKRSSGSVLMKNLNLDSDFLISISMDGPNDNKSFEKKLWKCFNEKGATSFLSLGSCRLHSSHNGFRQGFKSFECDVDQLACDMYFFLKYSSARRDDYKFVEEITEVTV